MALKSKAYTFIGFAVKARKIKCGVNAVATIKGSAPLLILCRSASENTKKDGFKLAKKLNAKMLVTERDDLENIVYKENCKLAAITDDALATAVIENSDGEFTEYTGGY